MVLVVQRALKLDKGNSLGSTAELSDISQFRRLMDRPIKHSSFDSFSLCAVQSATLHQNRAVYRLTFRF